MPGRLGPEPPFPQTWGWLYLFYGFCDWGQGQTGYGIGIGPGDGVTAGRNPINPPPYP